MGGAAAAAAVGGFGEVEDVEFVVGEIKEGPAVVGGAALREHQPGELTREVG